jgi:ribosomal protein RSM22 (predicted rRNA methylase)
MKSTVEHQNGKKKTENHRTRKGQKDPLVSLNQQGVINDASQTLNTNPIHQYEKEREKQQWRNQRQKRRQIAIQAREQRSGGDG